MIACLAVLIVLLSVSITLNLVLSGILLFRLRNVDQIDDSGPLGGAHFDVGDSDNVRCDSGDPSDWWKRGEEFNYGEE